MIAMTTKAAAEPPKSQRYAAFCERVATPIAQAPRQIPIAMTAQSILIRIFLVFPFIFLSVFSPSEMRIFFLRRSPAPTPFCRKRAPAGPSVSLFYHICIYLSSVPAKFPLSPKRRQKAGRPHSAPQAARPSSSYVCYMVMRKKLPSFSAASNRTNLPFLLRYLFRQPTASPARDVQGSFVRPALPFPRRTFRFIATLPLSSFIRKGDFQRETKQETGQRKMQAKPLSALSEFYRHGSFHPDFHEVPVRALHFEQLARHAEGNEGDHLRKIHRFQPIAPLSVPELRRQRPVADEHLDQL